MAYPGLENLEHLNIYFPGNIEIKIDRASEWTRVQHGIDNLERAINRSYEQSVEKIGKRLVKIIHSAIDHGRPPGGGTWEPLSQNTLKAYSKSFPSATTPYQRSGTFYNSIDIYQEEHGKRTYVGVSQYYQYTNGMTLIQLAKLLEFGSYDGRIPARPLFNPALEAIGGKKYIRQEILKNLRENAQRIGFKYVRIR